jgi:putative MATE family efflux protein
LGAVPLAAVTISGNLLRLIGVFSLGISTGTVILISQLIGAKKQEQAEDLATQALILATVFSGLISVVGYFSAEFGLRMLGAEPGVIQLGKTYMQITLVGSITMFASMTLGAIYRSTGDTVTPMVVLILSTILNIVLDLVLIFGLLGFPRLGVAGSAYATVIGRGVGALVLLLLCISGQKGLYVRYRRPNFDKMWQIMRLGIFSAMQGFWRHLSRIGFIWFVAKHGTLAVAAYGVCMRLRVFVMNPGFALAGAVAPMVGQNIGAKRIDRARTSAKFGTIVAVAMMTVVGLVVFIIPDLSIRLFINDSTVIEIGRVFLRYSKLN